MVCNKIYYGLLILTIIIPNTNRQIHLGIFYINFIVLKILLVLIFRLLLIVVIKANQKIHFIYTIVILHIKLTNYLQKICWIKYSFTTFLKTKVRLGILHSQYRKWQFIKQLLLLPKNHRKVNFVSSMVLFMYEQNITPYFFKTKFIFRSFGFHKKLWKKSFVFLCSYYHFNYPSPSMSQ